jgi:hypothetical protein
MWSSIWSPVNSRARRPALSTPIPSPSLLGDEQAQTGPTRLYGLELLAISAEAVMLKPVCESLFTDAERVVARSRLALLFVRRRSPPTI